MSDNEMNDDKLEALKSLRLPTPSEGARQRARDAAMLAFDAEQEKSATAAQGKGWRERLSSIVPSKGNWIMDRRLSFGLGTAAVAVLLLPLGYQLYTSTAITPIGVPPVTQPATLDAVEPAKPLTLAEPAPEGEVATGQDVMRRDAPVTVATEEAAPGPTGENKMAAGGAAADAELDTGRMAAPMTAESAAGMPGEGLAGFAPAPDATMAMPTEPSGDEFTRFDESPVKIVAEAPVSTFSIDVDTASYSYVRRSLSDGYVPAPDAVRIEEMINYFSYDYPAPETAETPFRPTMQVYPTPWNARTQLLQIGIKGLVPPVTEDRPSNLVFLLDTSGSMDEPDKLPLLKRAFALLVDQLSANDTVSIVVYAGSAGVVLEPTKASDKARILDALETLYAGGSTAGAQGIELAYRLAEQHRITGGVNRVILATDGDFNVGIDDPEDLKTFIKGKRDAGIFLSVLGFGQGNLDDATMQALAQNGNGNASYIDSFKEAQKVLVAEGGGTLETIAKDVKIQVEFNPAVVAEYRLIGYETRALNREDFNNDKVDAGDIGAGHTVTALYEITPVGSGAALNDPLRYDTAAGTPTATALPSDEIGFLKMRYKLPEGQTSTLIEMPISTSLAVDSIEEAADDARWAAAVAAFAQKLKGSNYGGAMSYAEIKALAQGARGPDANGYRAEFVQLIDTAAALDSAD